MKILLQWGIPDKENSRNALQLKSDNKGDSGNGLQLFQWWKSDKWKFRRVVASVPAMEIGSNQCQTSAMTKCKWKLQFLWEKKNLQPDSLRKFLLCQHQSPTKEMPFSNASISRPYLCDQLKKSKFGTSAVSRLASLLLPPWHFLTSSLNSTFRNHSVPAKVCFWWLSIMRFFPALTKSTFAFGDSHLYTFSCSY